MSYPSHWLSYDLDANGRHPRPGGRPRWPWWILLAFLLLLLLTGGTIAGWYGYALVTSDPIQTVLPDLLTDDSMTVYVVDDSGSMGLKTKALHEAMHEVADKPAHNSQVALIMFGDSHRTLFDFTDPADAPWNTAIPYFQAESGGTNMFTALRGAHQMMPDSPVCGDSACRQKRIVLMSDGIANDTELAESTVSMLKSSDVAVDTVAVGIFFINTGALRNISEITGGVYTKSR